MAKLTDLSAVAVDTIVTVWTPATGKKFRIQGGEISASAAISVLFEDNASGAGHYLFRTPKLVANTPYSFKLPGNGIPSAAINNVLKATGSGAGAITGFLWGVEDT